MKGLGITVTEHLLIHQKESPAATGRLTRLLQELIFAAKIISREVNKAGLVDILGLTGDINVQGERVRKLDDFANHVLIYRMERSGVVCAMSSEENADIITVPEDLPKEDYLLTFDPLDGSSNIDANVNIGTIFSIHRKVSDRPYVTLDDFLRRGSKQVAAGYFIYGPSTMLVYTTGKSVNGFTLDPSVGEFLLSHQNIKIPERGKVYSVNEAYTCYWDERTKKVVDYFKSQENERGKPYAARYIGSFVADFHRNLLYGGIFMYPADKKDPAKPRGKLRLLCEVAPMAYILKLAGGAATDGEQNILDIKPSALHERVPVFLGSKLDVEKATDIMQGKD
ncbi:MAG: class 1 fructose-bisphosphatase [Deltaproteobacteria bacterium]|nr:class 1 fructose-bisphosphatase [Deltaproteobacteria bacterium]MDL1960128.1 class 1 fructose-bisphosphatase [Deltaproteobacteria bacterium]